MRGTGLALAVLMASTAAAQTTVPPPAPSITSLSPFQVDAGETALPLTVTGTNFIPGNSVVLWNSPTSGQSILSASGASTTSALSITVPATLLTAAQSVSVQVQAGSQTSPAATFTIQPVPALSPASGALASTTSGSSYSTSLTVNGGIAPFTGSVISGALPGGFSLDPATLSITGVAPPVTQATTINFTIRVTDSNAGPTGNRFVNGAYSITVNPPAPLVVSPTTIPPGVAASAYPGVNFSSTGSADLTTLSLTGALPSGMSFRSGLLSGTPAANAAGNYPITVTATESLSGATGSRGYTLVVNPPLGPQPATVPLPTEGAVYPGVTLSGIGGVAPTTLTITFANLPSGLSVSGTTMRGTPGPGTAGLGGSIQVRIQDNAGNSSSQGLLFTVNPPITSSPSTLSPGTVGLVYPATPITAGGGGGGLSAALSGLPAGLSFANGSLSGTPAAGSAGTYAPVLAVTDQYGNVATRTYSLVIRATLTLAPSSLPSGKVGVAYGPVTFTPSGGSGNYSIFINGELPPGMFAEGNTLGGTPAANAAGTYPLTVQVTDPNGGTANFPYSLVIQAAITVSPATLPDATAGQPYGPVLFTASGGSTPHTFTLSGVLPKGLQFSGNTLNGTPDLAAFGSYPLTLVVRDNAGTSVSVNYTLNVAPGRLVVSSISLAAGAVGARYAQNVLAGGGVPPYTFGQAGGSMPPGLSLASSGLVSGVPLQAGTFTFTVVVSDGQQSGNSAVIRRLRARASRNTTATGNVTIVINQGLAILTQTLPVPVPFATYETTLAATGGTPPYLWTIVAGSLPPVLTLSALSGLISGTYTGDGSYNFVAQVTDASGVSVSRAFTISRANPAPAIATPSPLPAGVVGVPYAVTFAPVTAGEAHWSIDSGTPPAGLTLSDNGVLAGTPSAVGTASFSVKLTDAGGRTASRVYSLTINPALRITTTSPLPDAPAGTVSVQFAASGGALPYTWSLSSGPLPAGLALASNGLLSGSTSADGSYTFRVTVTDANGAQVSANFTLRVTQSLAVTTASLPDGALSQLYNAPLTAAGGATPYSFAATGLPAGLTVGPATGIISGTPGTAGAFTVAVTVTDQRGASATASLRLSITAPTLVLLSGTRLPDGTAGLPYAYTFTAQGGVAPYGWSVSAGAVPGLNLSPDGKLTGTPSASGTFTFTIVLTDTLGHFVRQDFTLAIATQALAISTASLPAGTTGSSYSATPTAVGGEPPYTWTATLPAGLRIDPASGAITGSTTAGGPVSITVTVSDSRGAPASRSFTVNFALPALSAVSLTGPPDVVNPLQQPALQLGLAGAYPAPINGTLTLTFVPDRGADDPAVQFSSGGRSVTFTIPAGANLATFAVPGLAVQTGTVAGTLTFSLRFQSSGVDITPNPPPTRQVRIAPAVPVITAVTATRTAGGLQVRVTGYSTTREVSRAVFRFSASPGGNLQTTSDLTVAIDSLFAAWFAAAESVPFGGQFAFTQPFTVQGDTAAVASVSVTLSNQLGTSAAATALVQ